MASSPYQPKAEEHAASDVAAKRGAKGGDDEIDAIFALRKKPKNSPAESVNCNKGAASDGGKPMRNNDGSQSKSDAAKKKKRMTMKKRKREKDETRAESVKLKDVPSKGRKRTQEGYRIYREDELRWNRKEAGGTSLCPFDCECCF